MRPWTAAGQPLLEDDRQPVLLIVLDGLGDRPAAQLGDRTPSEAARTPTLDAFAASGASGWHLPFGWGPAASSEWAHWSMFGYENVPFPGRAVLEGLGAGLDVPEGVTVTFAALRTSRASGDQVWLTGRVGVDDEVDSQLLLAEIDTLAKSYGARMHQLGRGEALLLFTDGPHADITDSDPFFETFHPWLRVRAGNAQSEGLARMLNELLLDARQVLLDSPVNANRRGRGAPPLDVLTTKWTGTRQQLPPFVEHVGVSGAAVTSSRLYRGLAILLGMPFDHRPPVDDPATDIATRISAAEGLIRDGARVVHVHTKAPDEAGHRKDPIAKAAVLEQIDRGLTRVNGLAEHAVVAVTGDHATPCVGGVLHSADPTPLVVRGPAVRSDAVMRFGEWHARQGWFGAVRAAELLPLLFNAANRPNFRGHRTEVVPTAALPDSIVPMPARARPARP